MLVSATGSAFVTALSTATAFGLTFGIVTVLTCPKVLEFETESVTVKGFGSAWEIVFASQTVFETESASGMVTPTECESMFSSESAKPFAIWMWTVSGTQCVLTSGNLTTFALERRSKSESWTPSGSPSAFDCEFASVFGLG